MIIPKKTRTDKKQIVKFIDIARQITNIKPFSCCINVRFGKNNFCEIADALHAF